MHVSVRRNRLNINLSSATTKDLDARASGVATGAGATVAATGGGGATGATVAGGAAFGGGSSTTGAGTGAAISCGVPWGVRRVSSNEWRGKERDLHFLFRKRKRWQGKCKLLRRGRSRT